MPFGPRTSGAALVALLDGRADGEGGVDDGDGVDGLGVSVVAAAVVGAGEPAGAALPLWCAGDEHAATSRRQVRVPTMDVARIMSSWLTALVGCRRVRCTRAEVCSLWKVVHPSQGHGMG
ncbi:Conserved hypothetical protein [Micromonospora lupini str. Lupac 08]|uniref:Uncharacterized protein n=1 Tax=Micromonospora lupini str. Lupac 08 TaxID=1150864 RepID=I0LB13_9ACTN|nr:Conserved hypothetical protein [Micromonospora lupini str. Lupac 08]